MLRDYSDDDGDGVLNKDDRCPDKKGPASNNGCPPTDPTRCDGCPEMVLVQGGTFTMGCQSSNRDGECYDDEKPPRSVTVQDFYIGKYEVSQAEWRRVMGSLRALRLMKLLQALTRWRRQPVAGRSSAT